MPLYLPLVYLLPIGLILAFTGTVDDRRAARAATVALAAFGLGFLAYGLVGFGFQFGGIGLITNRPGLQDLQREWSILDRALGAGWGLIGLDAFGVSIAPRSEAVLLLYVYHGALAGTATLLPILALAPRVRARALMLAALLWGGLVYPLSANWLWGGGWLSNLGTTVRLGHGTVDYAGALAVFGFGGLSALGALLGLRVRRGITATNLPPELPRAHLPMLMMVGAVVALVGLAAAATTNPLYADNLPAVVMFSNLVNAAIGGLVVAALYGWLVTGEPSPLLATRGALAGMFAVSAMLPFVAPGSAMIVGLVAGILIPAVAFLVQRLLHLDDSGLVVATAGAGGLWGTLALAIFATGQIGLGWNRTGERSFLGVTGQGVTGLLAAPGFAVDSPGQMQAQLIGILAVGLFAFVAASAVFFALRRAGGTPEP